MHPSRGNRPKLQLFLDVRDTAAACSIAHAGLRRCCCAGEHGIRSGAPEEAFDLMEGLPMPAGRGLRQPPCHSDTAGAPSRLCRGSCSVWIHARLRRMCAVVVSSVAWHCRRSRSGSPPTHSCSALSWESRWESPASHLSTAGGRGMMRHCCCCTDQPQPGQGDTDLGGAGGHAHIDGQRLHLLGTVRATLQA